MKTEETANQEPEITDAGEILQKTFEFTPGALCEYKQRGPYLVCTSCEVQHAVYVGMEKIMVGVTEAGMPILKKRIL